MWEQQQGGGFVITPGRDLVSGRVRDRHPKNCPWRPTPGGQGPLGLQGTKPGAVPMPALLQVLLPRCHATKRVTLKLSLNTRGRDSPGTAETQTSASGSAVQRGVQAITHPSWRFSESGLLGSSTGNQGCEMMGLPTLTLVVGVIRQDPPQARGCYFHITPG